jgi:uncharacterized membrane protein HdeD (DUF308 family)
MHAIFIVGAKLLGIFFVINGLIEASMLANPRAAGPFANQLALSCFIKLSAGTALAFFTGIIATGLRIQEQPADQLPRLSYRSALQVGIVLLGLYELMAVLPRVVARLTDYSKQTAWTRSPSDFLSQELIGFVAAMLLVFLAHRIAGLLERVSRQASDRETI